MSLTWGIKSNGEGNIFFNLSEKVLDRTGNES